jgi:hypothetical protein
LAVTVGGLLLLALLPGCYVWSLDNKVGAFMFPQIGQNLEKMPPDLLASGRLLEQDDDIEQGTILCGEEVASFFTPWSKKFRFVVTRPMYTFGCFGLDEACRESNERYFLMLVAQHGVYAPARRELDTLRDLGPAVSPQSVKEILASPSLPQLDTLTPLLDRYRVRYVIPPPPVWLQGRVSPDFITRFLAARADLLRQHGFREIYPGQEYSLWKRDLPHP